jgi:hypothetical protein
VCTTIGHEASLFAEVSKRYHLGIYANTGNEADPWKHAEKKVLASRSYSTCPSCTGYELVSNWIYSRVSSWEWLELVPELSL